MARVPVVPSQGLGSPGGSGAINIPDNYFFDDLVARNDYFIAHPGERLTGVQVVVGTTTLQLQEYDGSAWVDITPVVRGPPGTPGADGTDGTDGVGVPTGGTTGQVLRKKSTTNYDTEWGDGGSGSGDMAKSVYDTDDDGVVDAAEVAAVAASLASEASITESQVSGLATSLAAKADSSALSGYVPHSLATAVSQFLVSSGIGAFTVKTIADVKTLLGLGSAAYTETSAYAESSHSHSESDITNLATDLASKVPDTRTVNSKALSSDITLTTTDIGAEPTISTKNTAFNKNYGTTVTDVKVNGTQAVGSVDEVARIDHVHPTDTSRAASSHSHSESDVTNLATDLSGKQPIDSLLTAIAALTGTSGLIRVTGDGTCDLDTSVYLTAITKALVEAVLTGTISSHDHSGVYQPLATLLTAIAALSGNGLIKLNSDGSVTIDTSSYLTANQSITVSGDASGSGITAITLTLAASGATAGTYKSVTVDAKGRVTAGSNPTTLSGFGITDGALAADVKTWTEVTGTTQAMAVNRRYIANNAAQVVFTLPSTAAVGDPLEIAGSGAGGWKIAQNSGQKIVFGDEVTTEGTDGYLYSGSRYEHVKLICITANTVFSVIEVTGNPGGV